MQTGINHICSIDNVMINDSVHNSAIRGVRANVKVVRLKGIAMMDIKLHRQLAKAFRYPNLNETAI